MIAAWAVYALVVGALLAAAALALEGACRLVGAPRRLAWIGALAAGAALGASAPWRAAPTLPLPMATTSAASEADLRATGARSALAGALRAAREAIAAPARAFLAWAERRAPSSGAAATTIAATWAAASAALLLLLAAVHLRFRRARAAWPRAELHGVPVRIAPDIGPAVIGLARPEIVVPRWLLHRPIEEQRLALAHEREHVRAGDAVVLALGWTAAALFPWHPAAWWMLARLRLAVELDCDARVLRRGAAARSYGALLIEIAALPARGAGLRLGAPALADEPSHLERRLIAMTTRPPRRARARGATLALLAAGALLAACETALPTAAEVDRMDAASARQRAQRMKVLGPDDSLTTYTIDGVPATAAEAQLLASEEIASVEVAKMGGAGEVRITTRKGAEAAGLAAPSAGEGMVRVRVRSPVLVEPGSAQARTFTGLIFIDGARADNAALAALAPDDIESVEVVKGPAATSRWSEPEAANGVIRITTKRAARK